MFNSIILSVIKGLLWLAYLVVLLWCGGVIYYNTGAGYLGAGGFVAAMAALGFFRNKIGGAYFLIVGIALLVTGWFISIRAVDGGEWKKPWQIMPEVERGGTKVTIKNIRNFSYKSPDDYTVRYLDEEYDLKDVKTLDFAISHWDGLEYVAHTMLSFGFGDGRYLAVSVETRIPEGMEQGALPGLFKQYNLICLMAKEEDLFGLRTNVRKEDMFLYRLKLKPEDVRKILMYFLQRVNVLKAYPEFYNTITANCTTELQPPFKDCFEDVFDRNWSPLFNGMSDERGFSKGVLEHRDGETFLQLKERSRIPSDILPNPDYSKKIREHAGIR